MEQVNFAELESGRLIRASLAPLSRTQDYEWLMPIVCTTVDEDLRDHVRSNPPHAVFPPFLVEENLSAASDIIDRCMARYAELMEIEATAMQAAIDYQLREQLLDSEAEMALLERSALFKQASGKDIDGVNIEAAQARSRKIRDAFFASIRLHNVPGSALNYGERVRNLRRVYTDALSMAMQRLNSVAKGANVVFGIKVPPLPFSIHAQELPIEPTLSTSSRISVDDDLSIYSLVWWMREVTRAIRLQEATEIVRRIPVSCMPQAVVSENGDVDVVKTLEERKSAIERFISSGHLTFNLDEELLGGLLPIGFSNHRILSISAVIVSGPVFRMYPYYTNMVKVDDFTPDNQAKLSNIAGDRENFLATLAFRCHVKPPSQELIDDDYSPEWIDIGDMPISLHTTTMERHCLVAPQQILNLSPIGQWSVFVVDVPTSGPEHFRLSHSGVMQLVQDIQLLFEIVSREE